MSDYYNNVPELGEAQYEAEQAMLALNAADEAADAAFNLAEDERMNKMIQPMLGTLGFTARFMAECGIMSGDEADAWKDEMKDRELGIA